MKTNQAGLSVISTILIVVLLLITSFSAFRLGKNAQNINEYEQIKVDLEDVNKGTSETQNQATSEETVVVEEITEKTETVVEKDAISLGYIQGSLTYPSEELPPMVICAQNMADDILYCTDKTIDGEEFTNGKGYRLEIPEGVYTVYASTLPLGDYKAYYSAAVPCGLSVDCTDHTPIEVTVITGTTVTGVDPGDWYAN